MDQKNLLLMIIAAELNTANRLRIFEQVESCKTYSHLDILVAYSETEKQIADLLNTLMKGVIEPNE